MLVLGVTFILALLLWVILDNLNRRTAPPGPLKVPIFGNALQITLADKFTGPAYQKLAKKYGDVMSLKTGTLDSSEDLMLDKRCLTNHLIQFFFV